MNHSRTNEGTKVTDIPPQYKSVTDQKFQLAEVTFYQRNLVAFTYTFGGSVVKLRIDELRFNDCANSRSMYVCP